MTKSYTIRVKEWQYEIMQPQAERLGYKSIKDYIQAIFDQAVDGQAYIDRNRKRLL